MMQPTSPGKKMFTKNLTNQQIDILLTEKNNTLRQQTAEALKTAGYIILEAATAEEITHLLQTNRISLLVLDIDLENVNWREYTAYTNDSQHSYPIIAVSANNSPELRAHVLQEGCVDFIHKPYLPEEMLNKVRQHLGTATMRQTLMTQARKLVQETETRKVLAEALKQRDAQYFSLFNNNHAVMLIIDPQSGLIIDANPAACRFYGYSRHKLSSLQIYDLNINPPEEVDEAMQKALLEKERHFYFQHKLANGEHRDVEVYSGPVTITDKQFLFAIVHDITKRRLAETQLAQLAAVVEQAAESIIITDLAGNMIYTNPYVSQLTGYSKEELYGRSPRIFKSGYQDKEFYEVLWGTIRAGHTWTGSFINKKKDGSVYYEEAVIFPIKDSAGNLMNYAAVKRNVTEKIGLLEKIRRQAQALEDVLAAVPEGVVVVDGNGRILNQNQTAQELLSPLGVSVGDVLHKIGGVPMAALLKNSQQGETVETEVNGRIYQLLPQRMEPDITNRHSVILIRDITEAHEQQLHQQEQAKLAAVGQLAAGIAHDFNNIMAVITLYTQLSQRHPDLPEKIKERLTVIEEQSTRATELIQQILDFSRRNVLNFAPLNLVPFIKEQVKLLQRTMPESISIVLENNLQQGYITADPTRIQQVLLNLCLNARDAIEGYGEIKIRLNKHEFADNTPLPEMSPGLWFSISVSDSGHGIPSDVMPHIFEPFFTTKPREKGTGLGLAQVHGIVMQHNGTVQVASEVNKGTTFTLYFPGIEGTNGRKQTGTLEDVPQGNGEVILVVEDDEKIRTAVTDTLEILNYRVIKAGDGMSALSMLKKDPHVASLVLSDVVMPYMGGIELLTAVREHGLDIPFVFMTGYVLQERLEILKAYDSPTILSKPIQINELAAALHNALGKG
jgi:PAS domain S-box-containing protein